ncbi:hypothetical protein P8605_28125, partial [Streptomyces sp. T-3]|nr:hypothetical protein [Streptomyces sp. T-3]
MATPTDRTRFNPEGSYNPDGDYEFGYGARSQDETWEEWNPTEDSLRPVRGKHRVGKQRGGGLARSSTVLGVGVIAAVGAGGIATAKDRPPVPISLPDLSLPDASSLPGVGSLISDDADGSDSGSQTAQSGVTQAVAASATLSGSGAGAVEGATTADAGEALR